MSWSSLDCLHHFKQKNPTKSLLVICFLMSSLEQLASSLELVATSNGKKRKRSTIPKTKAVKVPKAPKPRKPRKPRTTPAGRIAKKRKTEHVVAIAAPSLPQGDASNALIQTHVQELQTFLVTNTKDIPSWSDTLASDALTLSSSSETKNEIKALKKEYDRCVQRRQELLSSVEKMLAKQYIHEIRMIGRELNLLAEAGQNCIMRMEQILQLAKEHPQTLPNSPMESKTDSKTTESKPKNKGAGKGGRGKSKALAVMTSASSASLSASSSTPPARSKNAIEQDMCPFCGTIVHHNHNSRSSCPNQRCGKSGRYLANTSSILAFGEEMEHSQNTQEFRKAYRKFLTPFFTDTKKPPQEVIDYVVYNLSYTHARSVHMVLRARIKSILVKSVQYKSWKNFDLWLAKYVKGEYIADIPKATIGDQLINMYHFSHLLWPQVPQPQSSSSKGKEELAPRNFIQKPPFTNAALTWLGYPELAKSFHRAKGKTHVKEKLQHLYNIFEHYKNQYNKHFMTRAQKQLQDLKSDSTKS